MKQEDVKFVRAIAARINPIYESWVGTDSYECSRLLSLLIESEAMREKAEFFKWYRESNQRYLVLQSFILLPYLTKEQQQHYDWSDADWIANQKKEWGI